MPQHSVPKSYKFFFMNKYILWIYLFLFVIAFSYNYKFQYNRLSMKFIKNQRIMVSKDLERYLKDTDDMEIFEDSNDSQTAD